jgi:hypothetical protein
MQKGVQHRRVITIATEVIWDKEELGLKPFVRFNDRPPCPAYSLNE